MKKINETIERARLKNGEMATTHRDGMNGIFFFSGLRCMVSDGSDWDKTGLPGKPWEHISVSCVDRCPTWDEMCFVKNMFWDENEVVMQLHPAKSNYVNYMPFCLHLWKPLEVKIPTPPNACVGPTKYECLRLRRRALRKLIGGF